ncbi:polysaccharide pyruvyl transferase family protein [Altererythrobacter lutimaris]|uniref:Polysaccharide pyruvyl transferase family protein n=1 Tax=Altererythrobacter lutimaris TaxID=2743979 RepID=A0A850H7W7_9SPHN|nr:polysaccharide pyruvyl transferase family protein [Altererythrobacter lutimaris]NVE95364.1 polysaccharide pyruvyl transferase family protein [Altererythrobacter lutimaris]
MIRMHWASHDGNIGDCYGPMLVAAYTGQKIARASKKSLRRRLISVGTIGQLQKFGTVDVWGAGFAGQGGTEFEIAHGYEKPRFVRFVPHATRGPFSRQMLINAGCEVPEVYGDPAILVNRLWPPEKVEKRWDLGVVLHLTEVDETFTRYQIPPELAESVKVFHTRFPREEGVAAVDERVRELQSCRRILSTGLHALVLAEACNIPCAHFAIHDGPTGRNRVDDTDVLLDHRMRDFYAGCGEKDVLVYRVMRHLETDWEDAIAFIDREWRPLVYDPTRLIESFPARHGVFASEPIVTDMERIAELVRL